MIQRIRWKLWIGVVVASAGLDFPFELAPAHFYQRFGPGDVRPLDTVYRFLEPGSLLDGSAPSPLREHWARAAPHRF